MQACLKKPALPYHSLTNHRLQERKSQQAAQDIFQSRRACRHAVDPIRCQGAQGCTHVCAGLGAVGVALVASAAMRLIFSTCKCKTTMVLCLLVSPSRRVFLCFPGEWHLQSHHKRDMGRAQLCLMFTAFLTCMPRRPTHHALLTASLQDSAMGGPWHEPAHLTLPEVQLTRDTADKLMHVLQASIISFYYPVTWIYPALILAGGLTTLVIKYKEVGSTAQGSHSMMLNSKNACLYMRCMVCKCICAVSCFHSMLLDVIL